MASKKVKKVATAVAEKKVVKKKTVASSKSAKKTCAKKSPCVKQQVAGKKQEEFVNNSNSYVLVDYPVENETVYGDSYVLRIGASFDGYVEVSFNDSEWQPCRFASGYWWYDWMYFKPGNIKIVARLVGNDGKVLKISDIRKCKVS
ncbi:MAG: hypothetical protein II816_00060 [Elusimicrobia bacterium]|nr:hypothetical protein [Elusimicrobiota bacterium]